MENWNGWSFVWRGWDESDGDVYFQHHDQKVIG